MNFKRERKDHSKQKSLPKNVIENFILPNRYYETKQAATL